MPYTFEVCKELVDDIFAIDEEEIFAAIPWIMERCKLVAEGAAGIDRRGASDRVPPPPRGEQGRLCLERRQPGSRGIEGEAVDLTGAVAASTSLEDG